MRIGVGFGVATEDGGGGRRVAIDVERRFGVFLRDRNVFGGGGQKARMESAEDMRMGRNPIAGTRPAVPTHWNSESFSLKRRYSGFVSPIGYSAGGTLGIVLSELKRV